MRKRFDHYLGYERHSLQYYEDFWQRRQHERTSLADLERKKGRKATSRSTSREARETMSEKPRRRSVGISKV